MLGNLSLSPILNKNKKVEQHIWKKTPINPLPFKILGWK